jgi:hypothetical protein
VRPSWVWNQRGDLDEKCFSWEAFSFLGGSSQRRGLHRIMGEDFIEICIFISNPESSLNSLTMFSLSPLKL